MSEAYSDLKTRIEQSITVSNLWLSVEENILKMSRLKSEILDTLLVDRRLFFMGNGGSAAEASHLAAEFVGKCRLDSDPYPAICLNDSITSITAIANDWEFAESFSRQVRAHCRKGDLVIGLSTSGSKNVVDALRLAMKQGCKVWLFTSEKNKNLGFFGESEIVAPTLITSIAQELHLQIGHAIVESLELENYSK